VIPGPSSFSAAIAACPYDCQRFLFYGFLPREKADRQKVLRGFKSLNHPVMVFDTPYRLHALLSDAATVLGGGSRGFLALDIGGPGEAYNEGSFKELVSLSESLTEKLNFILIIA
jgi:16S rRNA (cytidine1402-2'-O)-methyltransferase